MSSIITMSSEIAANVFGYNIIKSLSRCNKRCHFKIIYQPEGSLNALCKLLRCRITLKQVIPVPTREGKPFQKSTLKIWRKESSQGVGIIKF